MELGVSVSVWASSIHLEEGRGGKWAWSWWTATADNIGVWKWEGRSGGDANLEEKRESFSEWVAAYKEKDNRSLSRTIWIAQSSVINYCTVWPERKHRHMKIRSSTYSLNENRKENNDIHWLNGSTHSYF